MQKKYTLSDIKTLVEKELIPRIDHYTIFTLTGPLGSGKTTLMKEFFKQCDITDTITSPTFSYVNTYVDNRDRIFHHFDLYRITSLEMFIDSGFDEYLSKKNTWCLIEWPDSIKTLLKQTSLSEKTCHITLEYSSSEQNFRLITINP
jgi:tRNA threonylcarbamoyladenosine biosynthesis protein TsaE